AAQKILHLLAEQSSVALISDAGTPAISDPGAQLVAAVREAGHRVIPIPGPIALIAALSVSGFAPGPFLFYGFLPPRASPRREAIAALRETSSTIVFYEAPHRIAALIADLAACFEPQRPVLIARELTKVFETVASLALGDAQAWLAADANRERGEFVVALAPATEARASVSGLDPS